MNLNKLGSSVRKLKSRLKITANTREKRRSVLLESLENRQLMAADLAGVELSDLGVFASEGSAMPATSKQDVRFVSMQSPKIEPSAKIEPPLQNIPRSRETWFGELSPAVQNSINSARNLKRFSDVELKEITSWAVITTDPTATRKALESLKLGSIEDRTDLFRGRIAASVLEVGLEADVDYSALLKTVMQSKGAVLDVIPLARDLQEATGTLDPGDIVDPSFPNQWHLDASVSDTEFGINAEEAWAMSTGEGINISIVDSRQQLNHPDTVGNLLANMSYDDQNLDWNGDGVGDNNPGVFNAPGSNLWPNILDTDTDGDGILDRDNQRQQSHGTSVAGLALGDDDGTGIVGVAPDAGYAAYNFLEGPQSIPNTFSNSNVANTDVFNSSWGSGGTRQLRYSNFLDLQAIENAATDAVFVKSAGNNRNANGAFQGWDRANYDLRHMRQTMVIGASRQDGGVEWYSNPGSNLLVTAPVNQTGGRNSLTADVTDAGTAGTQRGYNLGAVTAGFNGTSAAAPMVSGVIALMLEVNPDLQWRDIQNILIDTAQKNGLIDVDADEVIDGGDADADGAIDNLNLRTTFSSSVDTDGNGAVDGSLDTDRDGVADPYHTGWFQNRAGNWVSDNFGFGMIDAAAAVKAAIEWVPLGRELMVQSTTISGGNVSEGNIGGLNSLSDVSRFTTESNLKVEWVEVTVNATLTNTEDLMLVLRSPGGTQSILMAPGGSTGQSNVNGFTFTTNQFWDESAKGDWTLEALDTRVGDNQSILIDDWQINIYGGTCCDASPLEVRSLTDLGVGVDEFAQLALAAGGLEESVYELNTVEQIGSGLSMGLFAGGGSSDLPIDRGLLFTSGRVEDAIGPNDRPDTSTNWRSAGHPLLDRLTASQTQDASGLGIVLTAKQNAEVNYQALFGSEEFDEWVGSAYNDGAGIFVAELKTVDAKFDFNTAENILLQPNSGKLTVNDLANREQDGSVSGKFYNPNPVCGDMNWEYDGSSELTDTQTFRLTAGHTYYIGIMVADAKDGVYDSALAISLDKTSNTGLGKHKGLTDGNSARVKSLATESAHYRGPSPLPGGQLQEFRSSIQERRATRSETQAMPKYFVDEVAVRRMSSPVQSGPTTGPVSTPAIVHGNFASAVDAAFEEEELMERLQLEY